MSEGENQQPVPPHGYQPNAFDVKNLQTARTLIVFASIAGPVSLLIGGMLLSGAGIVCGIVAWRKLKALESRDTEVAGFARQMKKPCTVALAMCGIAFVLNTVNFVVTMSAMLAMIESGEFVELMADMAGGTAGTDASTWG